MLNRIVEELQLEGLSARIVDFPHFGPSSQGVIVGIAVKDGRYQGQVLDVGISFQENAYPEYPPHFIHFKSSVLTKFTKHAVHDCEGEEWSAYSLPPSDLWDSLEQSQKNMSTYKKLHLCRILTQL